MVVTYRYVPIATETVASLSHPDCAGGGVTFTLFQKHRVTDISTRVTRTVTGAARCASTGQEIPVMAWTHEMERTFQALKARAPIAPPSYRMEPLVKRALLGGMLAVAVLGVGFMAVASIRVGGLEEAEPRIAAVEAAPAVGDLVKVATADDGQPALLDPDTRFRWYVLRAVTDDAVTLQAYETTASPSFDAPDLRPDGFTGPTETVPRDGFLQTGMLDLSGQPALVLDAYTHDAAAD